MNIFTWIKLLLDLFKGKGIDYKVHHTFDAVGKEKVEVSIECPYCKTTHGYDNKKKLYLGFFFNQAKKTYQARFICFRCEKKGSLEFLLGTLGLKKEYQNRIQKVKKNDKEDSSVLRDEVELTQEKFLNENSYLEYRKYEEINLTYATAINYFEGRGFNKEFLINNNIIFITKDRGDSFSKKFFGYALIPNYDYSNFVARCFLESEKLPRYLVYKAAKEKYGGEVNKEDNNIYLVEGPLDALKLNQLGYNSWSYGGKSKVLNFLENELYYNKEKNYCLVLDADIDIFKKDFLVDKKNNLIKLIPNLNFIHMGLTSFKDTGDLKKKKDFEEILKYKRGFDKRDLMEVRLLLLKKGTTK